jgi:hypothetical protein
MTLYTPKRNSITEIMQALDPLTSRYLIKKLKKDELNSVLFPNFFLPLRNHVLRPSSPGKLSQLSPRRPKQHKKSEKQTSFENPIIIIEGSSVKMRQKCRTPSVHINKSKFVAKLPLIKFD